MSDENSGCTVVLALAGIAVGIYLISKLFAIIIVGVGIIAKFFVYLGYNFIFFTDNLILIDAINPIIVWGIIGLLIGATVGIIIATKKYKLSKNLILYPITVFVLFLSIMGFVNRPWQYNKANYTSNINNANGSPSAPIKNSNSTEIQQPVVKQKKLPQSTSSKSARVIVDDFLALKVAPNINSKRILKINKNEVVNIISKTSTCETIENIYGCWYKIMYNGTEGYGFGGYLSVEESMLGNQSIVDEYIGTIGEKEFRLLIEKVDGENVEGFNITGTNKRPIKGRIEKKWTKPNKVGGDFTIFNLILKEPGDDKWDGEFDIDLWISDQERKGEGIWKSFNGKLDHDIKIKG